MSLGTSAVNNHLETKGQNSKWSPSVVASSGDKVEDDIDSAESDDDDAVVIGQNYKACQQPKEVGQRKESRSSAGSVYQKEKHAGLGLSSDRTAKSKLIGKENHSGTSNKSIDSKKVVPDEGRGLVKSSYTGSKSTGKTPVEGHSSLSTAGKHDSMERRRLERKGKFEIAEDSDENDDSTFDGLTSDLEGHFGVGQSTKDFGPSPRTKHEIDDIFGHGASRGTSSSKERDVDRKERPPLRPSARNQTSLEQNDANEFDRKHDDLRQKPRSGSGREKFDDPDFVDSHRTGITDNKAKFDGTEGGRPPSHVLEKKRPGLRQDAKSSRSRPGSGAVSPVDFSVSSKGQRSDTGREQDRKESRDDFQRPRSRSGSARDSPVDFSGSSKDQRLDAEREHDKKTSKSDFEKPRSRSGSGKELSTRTGKGIDKERTKSNPSSGRNSPADGLLSKDKRSNSRSNEKLADDFEKSGGNGKFKKEYSTYATKSERSLSPNDIDREFEEDRRRISVSKDERVDSRGRSIDGRTTRDDEDEITKRCRKGESESRSKSPFSLRSKSPTVSRSKSPTESRSKSPVEFTAKRPTLSRSKSPVESRSKSPIESRPKGMTESRSKSTSEPRSRGPTGTRSKSPVDLRSKSPVGSRSKSPVESQSKSPIGSRSKSPADPRSKSPSDSRSKSPVESRSKSPTAFRSKSPSAQRPKSPSEEIKKSPGHSRSRSFGNSQRQNDDTQAYTDKRRPRSRSDARTLEREDEKSSSHKERDFNMSHSLRKSSLGSMLRNKDSKYGLDSDESNDDDDDDDIIGMKRPKSGSRMQNGKEELSVSKVRTPNIKKSLAPGTNDSERSQGREVRVRDEETRRDFRPKSKRMGQKFRDAESAESEEESTTNRFKIKGHRDQATSKTTPVKANVVVKGIKSAQVKSKKNAKESPREFKNKTMTKRSLSLTNISNLKPKSPYVEDENEEKRKKSIVDSASLREQIYYDWLRQKTSKTKEELMELKRREKEKQEEEEREKQDKKNVSQKAFEAWQASKEDTITEKQMKLKEQKLKEKEKADEMQQKKLDAKKYFQSWKSRKDEELIEKRQKKKEESKEKRRKEIEDAEDKRSSSKKVYESWKSRKDELLKAKKSEIKEQEREKRLQEIEKMEKKRKAEKTFESWKEKKEKTPRGEMTTQLTQRAWCPGSRNTGNAIPQHVAPVIQRNPPNRARTMSASARLQNGSLRSTFTRT